MLKSNFAKFAIISVIIIAFTILLGRMVIISLPQKHKPETQPPVSEKPVNESQKIYSTFPLNEEIREKLDKKLYEISEIYRELKENSQLYEGVGERIISGILSDSFAFEYQNDKYILTYDHSGGAHCCGNLYVFRIDENNDLVLLGSSAPIWVKGNLFSISENNLKEKNGKLYLVTIDDRFAYYFGFYAGSPFFNRYFLIERNGLTLANVDWKEEFIENARKADEELKSLYEEIAKLKNERTAWDWMRILTEKVVNYIVAREDERAWENFEEIFNKFSNLIPAPEEITSEKIKNDILNIMNSVPY